MELQYTYWQDGELFVGFLDDYPDDSTQGLSLAELEEPLIEVYEIRQEEKNMIFTKTTVPTNIPKYQGTLI